MVDQETFQFRSVLICEYAIEGDDGKHTFAGVYVDDIVVDSDRETPVPFYLCIFIRPLKNEGTVFVELRGPGIALKTQMGFNGDAAEVSARDRIVFCPKVEFPRLELGQYVLSVGESHDHLTRVHEFFIARPGETYKILPPITAQSGAKPKARARKRQA